MFDYTHRAVAARVAARNVFGLVTLSGTIAIVASSFDRRSMLPLYFLGMTWLAASVAASVVSRTARATNSTTEITASQFAWSFAIPAVGCALLLPLTLQLPIAFLLGTSFKTYSEWIAISVVCVGAAHVTLAALYANRIHALVSGRKPLPIWVIFLLVCLAANVPLPVFPLPFVAVTGVPIVLIMIAVERWAGRELHGFQQPAPELPAAMLLHR